MLEEMKKKGIPTVVWLTPILPFINDTAENNDDMFFFDMLEFTRFLNPDDEAVAYTTPERLIFLNAPAKYGEKYREWDFIYCHECLHQLLFPICQRYNFESKSQLRFLSNPLNDCCFRYVKNTILSL